MKISQKTPFLILCFISFFGDELCGQVVYDVFNDKKIDFIKVSENIQPEFGRAASDISLEYFQIANPENLAQEAINKAILPLCRKSVDEESAYLKLLLEFKPRLAVFKEMHDNNYYGRGTTEETAMADMLAIECKPVSALDGKLYFSIRFEFQNPIYNRQVKNPSLQQYYAADLNSGQIGRHENSYGAATLDRVEKQISYLFNAQHHVAMDNVSLSEVMPLSHDEPGYSGLDISGTTDMIPRMDMAEAEFIPMGFGILVQFPEYTESSKLYLGQAIDVFLPFEQASRLANSLPGFAFPSEFRPQNTTFKNFDFRNPLGQFETMLKPPQIEDLFKQRKDSIPSQLSSSGHHILKTGEELKDPWIQVLNFDTSGVTTELLSADRTGKIHRRTTYSRDSEGNLLAEYIEDNKDSMQRFAYDKLGNLTVFERIKGIESSVTYCLYSGQYAYLYDTGDKSLRRFVKSEDELCVDNNCYVLNDHGKVIGVSYSEALRGYAQIAYDEQGRLVEIHRIHEDEDIYIEYDEQDRLQSWSKLIDLEKIQEVTYLYENDSELPYESHSFKSNSFSNSKDYVEVFFWKYW